MRVAITGATGFIGAPLAARLVQAGHQVLRIGRGPVRVGYTDITWSPARGELEAGALEGVDAVIHLAGAPIAQRWTATRQVEIRQSRVASTTLLSQTLAQLKRKPTVLVSGSAIGYYGTRGAELLDESSVPGDDFLAATTIAWEKATESAARAGIRVVHARMGIVLGAGGGALAKQLPLFRAGVGGTLGDGTQWLSAIGIDDAIAALTYCACEAFEGAVNIVSPTAVTNSEFTRVLSRVLSRPAVFRVPAFALRLALGAEMANLTVLASQRVRPMRLLEFGFAFRHPTMEGLLREITGRLST